MPAMIALARWTNATSTISMAQMWSSSSRPAAVPLTIASMVLAATFPTSIISPPARRAARSGTTIRLTRMAAGAPITEAITKCAAASGIIGPSKVVHQNRAGDAGHAAGHHDEERAARKPCQIGTDEQRRLDHA